MNKNNSVYRTFLTLLISFSISIASITGLFAQTKQEKEALASEYFQNGDFQSRRRADAESDQRISVSSANETFVPPFTISALRSSLVRLPRQ